MKPLLVGQAPSKNYGHERAFDGPSGRRLEKVMGIPEGALFEYFDTTNLLTRWPGKWQPGKSHREKGDAFRIGQAKRRASMIKKLAFRDVVIAGSKTWAAFGFCGVLDQVYETGTWYWRIPHPSAVNQAWNDPDIARRVRKLLWGLVQSRRERDALSKVLGRSV